MKVAGIVWTISPTCMLIGRWFIPDICIAFLLVENCKIQWFLFVCNTLLNSSIRKYSLLYLFNILSLWSFPCWSLSRTEFGNHLLWLSTTLCWWFLNIPRHWTDILQKVSGFNIYKCNCNEEVCLCAHVDNIFSLAELITLISSSHILYMGTKY